MNRTLLPVIRAATPTRRLAPVASLTAAAALPVVFVLAWATAQTRQPADYDPVRQTVSVMAGHAGVDRWIMTSALAVMAGCYGLLAVVLRGLRPVARVALAVAAVAALGILLSPQPATGTTLRHGVWAAVGEAVIALWPVLTASTRGRLLPPGVTRAAITASFVLTAWLMFETYWGRQLGLAERVTVTAQVCWPVVIAVALYRRPRFAMTSAVDTST